MNHRMIPKAITDSLVRQLEETVKRIDCHGLGSPAEIAEAHQLLADAKAMQARLDAAD